MMLMTIAQLQHLRILCDSQIAGVVTTLLIIEGLKYAGGYEAVV